MSKLNIKSRVAALTLLAYLSAGSAQDRNIPSNASFNLEDYAGKVVYVDFWASWCIPCKDSFPFMSSLQNDLGEDLEIVAINVDENKQDAMAFLEQVDHPFNIVYDPAGELAEGFALTGMPNSFLFDRSGKLVMVHVGFKKKQIGKLRQVISATVEGTLAELDTY